MLRAAGAIGEDTRRFFRAAAEGRLDEIQSLLAAGMPVDERFEPEHDFEMSALHVAARAGQVPVVRALLAAGADVQAETHHFSDDSRRQLTPLLLAAAAGHAEVLRVLIDAGARVDASTVYQEGETSLMRAAEAGHLEAVRVLLESGADPHWVSGKENLSAIARAERAGRREVAELLRRGGPE
jgi:ankyrin repeat protein